MEYGFSAKDLAFYPMSLEKDYKQAGTWPNDLMAVTEETFLKYTQNIPEGKVLGRTKKGTPTWIDAPPLTEEDLKNNVDAKILRLISDIQSKLKILEYAVELNMSEEGDEIKIKNHKKYLVLLNRVPSQAGYPREVVWPQLQE